MAMWADLLSWNNLAFTVALRDMAPLLAEAGISRDYHTMIVGTLGVRKITDLKYIHDDKDLVEHLPGLPPVPRRKLLELKEKILGQESEREQESEDENEKVFGLMKEAKIEALTAMHSAHADTANPQQPRLWLERASRFLNPWSKNPSDGWMALSAVKRAQSLNQASRSTDLTRKMNAAVKSTRDAFMWTVQANAPVTSRERFIEELHKATDGYSLPQNEFSLILHAQQKLVSKWFPQAFLSNAKHDANKRKGKRQPRGVRGARPTTMSEEEEEEAAGSYANADEWPEVTVEEGPCEPRPWEDTQLEVDEQIEAIANRFKEALENGDAD